MEAAVESKKFAWISEWEKPYESGLSLLLKFSWANCASASDVCHFVFAKRALQSINVKRQGRSLLDLSWDDRQREPDVPHLQRLCHAGSFAQIANRWHSMLASDTRVRFCPDCLATGFHSSFFQIDALRTCPLHGVPLQEKCANCGASTPPFAVVKGLFDEPFHCIQCGSLYTSPGILSNTWGSKIFDANIRRALKPIADWIAAISSSGIKWDQWERWDFPLSSMTEAADRRKATARLLTCLFTPTFDSACLGADIPEFPIYLGHPFRPELKQVLSHSFKGYAQEVKERLCIYRAIRRHLERQLHLPHLRSKERQGARDAPWSEFVRNDVFFPKAGVCIRSQALIFWRFRMEEFPIYENPGPLRLSTLNWPQNGVTDYAAWAGFVLASYHAAVATLAAWNRRAAELEQEEPQNDARVRQRELHREFAPLLDIRILPTFPSVSALEIPATSGEDKLAAVGPPDMEISNERRTCSRTTCNCRELHSLVPAPAKQASGIFPAGHIPSKIDQAEASVCRELIAPLDVICLPPHLDGSGEADLRRERNCYIRANNDLEAINEYFTRLELAPNSERNYRLQIQKCLVWMVAQRHKPMSSLTPDDAQAFYDFLCDPRPREIWVNAARKKKHVEGWAPFRSVPTAGTRDFTLQIVANLFNWWNNHRYVKGQPFLHLPFMSTMGRYGDYAPIRARNIIPDCLLGVDWEFICQAIQLQHSRMAVHPAKAVLFLAYYQCLKPGEIVHIFCDSLERIVVNAHKILWRVRVTSREEDRQCIFLLPPVIDALCQAMSVGPEQLETVLRTHAHARLVTVCARVSLPDPETIEPDGDPHLHVPIYALTKPVFSAAAKLADDAGNLAARNRLGSASLNDLSLAYQVHVNQLIRGLDSLWYVTGAKRLLPKTILEYGPLRSTRPLSTIVEDIESLRQTFKG